VSGPRYLTDEDDELGCGALATLRAMQPRTVDEMLPDEDDGGTGRADAEDSPPNA
jgi:hypothetical protein